MAGDSKLWEQAYKAHKESKKRTYKVPSRDWQQQPVHPKQQSYQGVKAELAIVKRQLSTLKQRKKHLEKQLREHKVVDQSYLQKPFYVYVLQLEHGCYYVGISRNVDKRFASHQKGKGAVWTKAHRPISIIERRNTKLLDEAEAGLLENELTLQYAEQYGHTFVRGGGYCQKKPNWPDYITR